MSRFLLLVTVVGLCLVSVGLAMAQSQSAPAAGGTKSVDIDARMRAYEPFDGNGRYKMQTDDGVRGVQGLFTLAGRWGARPYDKLSAGEGVWQSERVIFRDVDT